MSSKTRARLKFFLHWGLFLIVVAAGFTLAFYLKGTLAERVLVGLGLLSGLFVALGNLLPAIDKTVDNLPSWSQEVSVETTTTTTEKDVITSSKESV